MLTSSATVTRRPNAFLIAILGAWAWSLAGLAGPAIALTTSWTNPAGGDWATPANWDHGVPGASDDAVIALAGTYTVTCAGATVGSLTLGGASGTQTLSVAGPPSPVLILNGASRVLAGGSLVLVNVTVDGAGALANTGAITLSGCDFNPALDNAGQLVATLTSRLDGPFANSGSMTVRGEFAGAAHLTVASGFVNSGTLDLISTFAPSTCTLAVPTGTLTNAVGGTIHVIAGGGGFRTLAARLDNRGTLTLVNTGLIVNQPSADHMSSGLIDVSGGNLTIIQSGASARLTTSGPITIGATRTLSVSGGEWVYDGGAVTGSGTLSIGSAAVTLHADLAPSSILSAQGSTVAGPGHLINLGTLRLASCVVDAALDQNGYAQITGATQVNGALAVGSASTISVQSVFGSSSSLTVAGGFSNPGTIELTNDGGGATGDASLTVAGGVLENAVSGSIVALAGGGGTRILAAALDNLGTVSVAGAGLTLSRASADHLNRGVITVTGGNLTIVQSGTTPSLTNSSLIRVGAGRVMTSTTGAFVNAPGGTLAGEGRFDVGGTLSNAGTIAPGSSPGILSVTGDCPFASAPEAALAIEIGGTVAGAQHDRLALTGAATLHGTLAVSMLPGFISSVGDSFRVLTAGSRTGAFDAIVVTGAGHPVFDPRYDATGLTLVTIATTGVADRGSIAGLARVVAWPNPARGPMSVTYTLPARRDIEVAVFDAAGRRVRVLASGSRDAGIHRGAWDGRDAGGATCVPGVYFIRLDAEEGLRAEARAIRIR